VLIEWIAGAVLGGVGGVLHLALGGLGAMVGAVPGGSALGGGIVVGWSWLNTFLPMQEVAAGMAFLVGVYLLLFAFRLVLTVWGQIPIIGGHG
jgi:hypothetical protein